MDFQVLPVCFAIQSFNTSLTNSTAAISTSHDNDQSRSDDTAGWPSQCDHFATKGSSGWLRQAEFGWPPPGKGPPMNNFVSLDDRQQHHPRPPPAPSHTYATSMENSAQGSLQSHVTSAPPWSTSGIPPWSTATRPLSDIRELTEPSLIDITNRKPPFARGLSKKSSASHMRNASLARKGSITARPEKVNQDDGRERHSPRTSPSTPGDRSSIYSIPPGNVPPRSSSRLGRQRSTSQSRAPVVEPPPPRGQGYTIPNRGHSTSPVKDLAARFDPVSFESTRRIPSRTFIRSQHPEDILDAPSHRHPRISVDLHTSASLFVGGGSIEGHVRLNVDDAERVRHKRAIALGRVSVDLLGVEEMSGPRRFVFLNLATELVDAENPPPQNMVESLKQISPIDPFWLLAPSISSIPFMMSLPLDVGPPPFQSKHARIRYLLCVTLLVRDQGRQYLVRSSRDVSVLSVYDRKHHWDKQHGNS